MRLKRTFFTLAAMCSLCAVASPSQTYLHGYSKNGISRTFLNAHAPDQPPKYSRSEIMKLIRDAKTAEDFERLGNYFDYQSLLFEQKADEQLNELERLVALRYHAKSYPIQVDYTRELLKEYRSKADECSARASAYRAHTTELTQ